MLEPNCEKDCTKYSKCCVLNEHMIGIVNTTIVSIFTPISYVDLVKALKHAIDLIDGDIGCPVGRNIVLKNQLSNVINDAEVVVNKYIQDGFPAQEN